MKIALISVNTHPSEQGIRIISSCLKQAGHSTRMIFLPLGENYYDNYSPYILNQLNVLTREYELVGISSMASTAPRAVRVIEHMKAQKKLTIWGGIHATLMPGECVDFADVVCRGEGEDAVVELVNNLEEHKDITKISNLWIKQNGRIYKNDIRPYIDDLNRLPYADYDFKEHFILEKDKIVPFKERHLYCSSIYYLNIRGCPNSCTFCSNHFIKNLYQGKGKAIRSYSVDYIISELMQLKEKIRSLEFIDFRAETLFIMKMSEVVDFCEKYKKNIGLPFHCLADPPTMDEEKLRLFIDAGLRHIIMGIQSGSDRVNFELYKRYIKRHQVIKAAEIVNKYKNRISICYDFIATNPYETKEDIIETIELIRYLPKPFFLSINNLVYFPGTEFYDWALRDNLISKQKNPTANLNYWDRFKHIRLKRKNIYLNLILNLLRGPVVNKKYGKIPNWLLNFFMKKQIIDFSQCFYIFTLILMRIIEFYARANKLKNFLAKKIIYRKKELQCLPI